MATDTPKPIHSLIIDANSIIQNQPPVSTLLGQAEILYTIPAVIDEIRDAVTRARIENTLMPFLKLRSPRPASIKIINDFARKTGDLEVLSRPDIHLMALAYELECERSGGDWRLRSVPGQKKLNGKAPEAGKGDAPADNLEHAPTKLSTAKEQIPPLESRGSWGTTSIPSAVNPMPTVESKAVSFEENPESTSTATQPTPAESEMEKLEEKLDSTHISPSPIPDTVPDGLTLISEPTIDNITPIQPSAEQLQASETQEPASQIPEPTPKVPIESVTPLDTSAEEIEVSESEDSDAEGWITPVNLKKHQEKDANGLSNPQRKLQKMEVAVITSDFAMQNVILRMNLNLVSPTLQRIRELKSWVLRCHACFYVTKDMSKQFCARCGKPTLLRTSCSTDKNGNFRVHLKKNKQWNTRGDVYSIPKPVAGTSNGKLVAGGGKGGWGQSLILAEDQKEYVKAMTGANRRKEKDLMDEDYLPNILSGDRGRGGGRPKVGAGKNVNSKKRN